MNANLNENQRALLTHISRFGSDGYPIIERNDGRFSWHYRGIGTTDTWPSRELADQAFEAYTATLRSRLASVRYDKCPVCGYYGFNGQECFDCGYRPAQGGAL
jgi:hypothetical protein